MSLVRLSPRRRRDSRRFWEGMRRKIYIILMKHWRALPDHGLAQKGKQCKGGKKSKQRFTIAFLVNAAGVKETPIVVRNSENPRCFDKNSLPVRYYHQKKAWMTRDILDSFKSENEGPKAVCCIVT